MYSQTWNLFTARYQALPCKWTKPCAVQIASQLDSGDKATIEKAVDETIAWLDANQLAEVDELEHRLKEVEGKCGPIISKMYQAGGEGAGPGDMPGALILWSLLLYLWSFPVMLPMCCLLCCVFLFLWSFPALLPVSVMNHCPFDSVCPNSLAFQMRPSLPYIICMPCLWYRRSVKTPTSPADRHCGQLAWPLITL